MPDSIARMSGSTNKWHTSATPASLASFLFARNKSIRSFQPKKRKRKLDGNEKAISDSVCGYFNPYGGYL